MIEVCGTIGSSRVASEHLKGLFPAYFASMDIRQREHHEFVCAANFFGRQDSRVRNDE